MLDTRVLRNEPEAARAALARRGDQQVLADLDAAIEHDARLRQITTARDEIRSRVNAVSKQVGQLRRSGSDDDVAAAERLQAESRQLGDDEKRLAAEHDEVSAALRDRLLVIPNLPHPDAPDGASDADNPVVTAPVGLPDEYPDHQRVPHWDAAAELGILDNERAAKISGAMFTMQRGLGATLGRALCQLALDRNADAFEEIRPPTLVSTATLTSAGQLPKFADDAYAIERDDLWCIPTAEVPLTSVYAGEILNAADLPLRMMASTASYRREAGSAGRDTRGMLRTHEFDKVEILAIATPEDASSMLDELVERAVRTIAELELPYRVVDICAGDMGQSHHRSFDVEVYAPGSDRWLEVSSVSWFSDYQGRRADIRFRREGERGGQVVHTLNGSALAVPRVWAAIIENHRQPDGSVRLPEAVRPYMRGAESIAVNPP